MLVVQAPTTVFNPTIDPKIIARDYKRDPQRAASEWGGQFKAKADRFAQDVAPILADIEASGITSLVGIARELNAREIRNARGGIGQWTAATVSRLRRRLCPAEGAAA